MYRQSVHNSTNTMAVFQLHLSRRRARNFTAAREGRINRGQSVVGKGGQEILQRVPKVDNIKRLHKKSAPLCFKAYPLPHKIVLE